MTEKKGIVSGIDEESGFGSEGAPVRARSNTVPPPKLERERIGRYEVVYPLSAGGMASVHVGRMSGIAGFERLVAIKVIHQHLMNQREFVTMFLDEARLAARIHHPNVGEIIEIGEEDGLLYMVGELIHGADLREIFRKAKRSGVTIPQGLSAYICAHVCLGLHNAHEMRDEEGNMMNLVHRDISPRNILLTFDGFVKLIDFGVASARGRLTQTESEGLKGKLGYIPPEQIAGEKIDRRGDLFSLGVVLFMMVTGSHPFPAANDAARIKDVLYGKFLPPREVNPAVRPELEKIILKAMARDRNDRYRTAAAMGADLEKFARMSGDRAGVAAISAVTKTVCADKITDHKIRLQAFHKRKGDESEIMDITGVDAGQPEAPEQRDSVTGTMAASPKALREAASSGERRTLPRPALLAGVGVIAVALLSGVLIAVGGSDDEGKGDSAAASEEPKEEPKPGAAQAVAVAQPSAPEDEGAEKAAAEEPAAKEPKAAKISLKLAPEDAVIEVDGVAHPPGTNEVSLPADGKTHSITARAPGFEDAVKSVVADGDRVVDFFLDPVEEPEQTVSAEEAKDGKKPTGKRKKRSGRKKTQLMKSPY